jgi:hypothetical protein
MVSVPYYKSMFWKYVIKSPSNIHRVTRSSAYDGVQLRFLSRVSKSKHNLELD